MRKFLWLNPVVLNMYERTGLEHQLFKKGYELVTCQEDHIGTVREKYWSAYSNTHSCVADMRCPMAVEYIKKNYDPDFIEFPDIEPILLHCARELQKRYSNQGDLWIITPCLSLAAMGNSIGMKGVQFFTWKEFAWQEGISLQGKVLKESPIPPGFFSDYKEQSVVLDSREKIDHYFSASEATGEKRMMELLYCPRGCHHGDGV